MCERVVKPWGNEVIFARTERYAGKILTIHEGAQLSYQYHTTKDETIYVLEGIMRFEFEDECGVRQSRSFTPGMSYHIPHGMKHRFIAETASRVFEVSTPELDDIVRLEDVYGRVPS